MYKFLLLFLFIGACFFSNAQTEQIVKKTVHKKIFKKKAIKKNELKSKKTTKKKSKKTKEEVVIKKEKPKALMYNPIVGNGKSLTGNISTQKGFRVCIYSGSNREEAFKIKQQYILSETKNKSYIDYNRPYYKIKVGDFDDKKKATKELKKVISKFPNAFITPDIVTIKNIEIKKVRRNRMY